PITVVICAYNAAVTLDECLTATCALEYPNLEVLVVDDGSTDATAAIARRHPRARLVQIPHAGLSVARNAGARAATGEIVAYLHQRRGYGRAEALVEARHPDRFTPAGTARWRGRIYDPFLPEVGRARIYRGAFGSASYQSVYREAGYALDVAHQMGVPLAVV